MKQLLALFLAMVTLISLVACAGQKNETPTATADSPSETVTTPATTEEPEVMNTATDVAWPLTWKKLNREIPIATDDMSEEELRQLCADFFRLQLTFAWTPSEKIVYNIGSREVTLYSDWVYGGQPYVSSTFSNIYKFLEFYDEKTGVLDVAALGDEPHRIIGNQCSASAFWAWARACNSFTAGGTSAMLPHNGALTLGEIEIDSEIEDYYFDKIDTREVLRNNGTDVVFDAYSKLKLADGVIYYYTSAGHVMMISQAPVVVKNADGTINGDQSYVLIMDQQTAWTREKQDNDLDIRIQGGIDKKFTFTKLYNNGYVPFTIAELNKADPVEKATASTTLEKEEVTVAELLEGFVTSNYAISDVTLTVKKSDGTILFTKTGLTDNRQLVNFRYEISCAASAEELKDLAGNTVEITTRVGSGEKLSAFTGKIIAE